jgi:hypothetical protein
VTIVRGIISAVGPLGGYVQEDAPVPALLPDTLVSVYLAQADVVRDLYAALQQFRPISFQVLVVSFVIGV